MLFRSVIEFIGGENSDAAQPAAALTIGAGRLTIRGVAVRMAEQQSATTPLALFGIGTGRLICEDVVLRMPGNPLATVDLGARRGNAFIVASGASGTAAGVTMLRSRAAGDAVFLEVASAATGGASLEWSGGVFVSPRQLLVAAGASAGELLVDCHLHDATFCCNEGMVALGDTSDRPDSPRLRVRATDCRFVLTAGDRPLILQAGAGEPDRYRAAEIGRAHV